MRNDVVRGDLPLPVGWLKSEGRHFHSTRSVELSPGTFTRWTTQVMNEYVVFLGRANAMNLLSHPKL